MAALGFLSAFGFAACIVLLMAGMISPSWAIWWGDPKHKSRKKAAAICGVAASIFFALFVVAVEIDLRRLEASPGVKQAQRAVYSQSPSQSHPSKIAEKVDKGAAEKQMAKKSRVSGQANWVDARQRKLVENFCSLIWRAVETADAKDKEAADAGMKFSQKQIDSCALIASVEAAKKANERAVEALSAIPIHEDLPEDVQERMRHIRNHWVTAYQLKTNALTAFRNYMETQKLEWLKAFEDFNLRCVTYTAMAASGTVGLREVVGLPRPRPVKQWSATCMTPPKPAMHLNSKDGPIKTDSGLSEGSNR